MRQMFSKRQLIELIQQYAPEVTAEAIEEALANIDAGTIANYLGFDSSGNIVKQEGAGEALPEVTSADNGDVLEVISGAWGKGGHKVKVIDAPSSTTLTEEEEAIIREGVFINGEFLGFHNPVLFPCPVGEGYTNWGMLIGSYGTSWQATPLIRCYKLENHVISAYGATVRMSDMIIMNCGVVEFNASTRFKISGGANVFYKEKRVHNPPADNSGTYQIVYRGNEYKHYKPVAVTGITSGDDLATIQDDLVNAMKDHLDVEINGYRARYQYEDNGYVVYSSMSEADSGVNLQINMISLLIASPNTISFNQMKFAPIS